jgi:hypothetical protein
VRGCQRYSQTGALSMPRSTPHTYLVAAQSRRTSLPRRGSLVQPLKALPRQIEHLLVTIVVHHLVLVAVRQVPTHRAREILALAAPVDAKSPPEGRLTAGVILALNVRCSHPARMCLRRHRLLLRAPPATS